MEEGWLKRQRVKRQSLKGHRSPTENKKTKGAGGGSGCVVVKQAEVKNKRALKNCTRHYSTQSGLVF